MFYCSASSKIDPKYNQAAREVVRAACLAGYGIVSGGSFRGTMGVVCDVASEFGAPNKGVLPSFMKGLEYKGLTELIWTDTMSERKEEMRKGVDIAVALPGGIGTMDELMETLVLAKLGQFGGKVAAFNFEGFFNPLKDLLDHFLRTGMLEKEDYDLLVFADTAEEMAELFI